MPTATETPDYVLADELRAAVNRPIDVRDLAARSTAKPIREALARDAHRERLVAQLTELESLANGRPDDLVAEVLDGMTVQDLLLASLARVDEQKAAAIACSVMRTAIAKVPAVKDRELVGLLIERDAVMLHELVADWRNDPAAGASAYRLLDRSPLALRGVEDWPTRPDQTDHVAIPGAVDMLCCLYDNPPRSVRR